MRREHAETSERVARRDLDDSVDERVRVRIDGGERLVERGTSVLTLLLEDESRAIRLSPARGAARSGYCLMGVCQECVVTIDGVARQACVTEAKGGMTIVTAASA